MNFVLREKRVYKKEVTPVPVSVTSVKGMLLTPAVHFFSFSLVKEEISRTRVPLGIKITDTFYAGWCGIVN